MTAAQDLVMRRRAEEAEIAAALKHAEGVATDDGLMVALWRQSQHFQELAEASEAREAALRAAVVDSQQRQRSAEGKLRTAETALRRAEERVTLAREAAEQDRAAALGAVAAEARARTAEALSLIHI